MVVLRGSRKLWTECTATLYRTRPRLILETSPFTMESTKTVIPVSPDLRISYKEPIAKDFTLLIENNSQIISLAVFSEADGNALLNALAKGGANVLTDEQIQLRESKQHSTISRKTRLSRRRSTGTWLRTPKDGEETAIWYLNDDEDMDDESVFEDSQDSLKDDESVTDGGLSSYFGTLPKATKRLFKSELNLYKSDSNLRLDKYKFVLPDDFKDEDKFDPGLLGLVEDPGVMRFEFDDYPDSVYESGPDDMDGIQDHLRREHEWIRKSYEELDLDLNRGDCDYLSPRVSYKVMSQSTGNITDSVSNDYFEYVRNRFETEVPDYEEAVNQSRIMLWNSEQSLGQDQVRNISFKLDGESDDDTGDFSDNSTSTVKFSGSDGETEV